MLHASFFFTGFEPLKREKIVFAPRLTRFVHRLLTRFIRFTHALCKVSSMGKASIHSILKRPDSLLPSQRLLIYLFDQ